MAPTAMQSGRRTSIDKLGASLSDVQARMEIFGDVDTGSPTNECSWRARRLHTYDAHGHYSGDGQGQASPVFHKDYRHYKYYGTVHNTAASQGSMRRSVVSKLSPLSFLEFPFIFTVNFYQMEAS